MIWMLSQDKLKDERQEKQYGDFGTGQDIRNNLLWTGGSKGLRGVSKELWHLIAGSGKEAGLWILSLSSFTEIKRRNQNRTFLIYFPALKFCYLEMKERTISMHLQKRKKLQSEFSSRPKIWILETLSVILSFLEVIILSLWGPGSLDIRFKKPQASDATPGWKNEKHFIVLWADSTQDGISTHDYECARVCSQSIVFHLIHKCLLIVCSHFSSCSFNLN